MDCINVHKPKFALVGKDRQNKKLSSSVSNPVVTAFSALISGAGVSDHVVASTGPTTY